jgi:hypothetical protein
VAGRASKRRNLYTHLTALIVVPGCIALCWWQVTRALSGNSLSWAYVFEWPIFGGYAVFMWWKLIHEPAPAAGSEPSDAGSKGSETTMLDPPPGASPANAHPDSADSDSADPDSADVDEELASYNRYLAALHASGRRKHW